MRILLDNCVHYKLLKLLSGHSVKHAVDLGWEDLRNGDLIKKASTSFDVIVTTDKKIRFEQNLQTLPVVIVELHSRDTRIEALEPMVPHIQNALLKIGSSRFLAVHPNGFIEFLA